jgi:hypothetical protein
MRQHAAAWQPRTEENRDIVRFLEKKKIVLLYTVSMETKQHVLYSCGYVPVACVL